MLAVPGAVAERPDGVELAVARVVQAPKRPEVAHAVVEIEPSQTLFMRIATKRGDVVRIEA